MNRNELVDAICADTGLGRGEVDRTVQAMLRHTALAVRKGQRVSLVGFGTFERRDRRARRARNPRTGEPIKVKAAKVPSFRPGATFKELVQTGRTSGRGASGWAQLPPGRKQRSSETMTGSGVGGAAARPGRRAGSSGSRAQRTTGLRAQQPRSSRAGSARNTQRGSRRRG